MRRLSTLAALLLLLAPAARAVPITGYAIGEVTTNDTAGGAGHPSVYTFTPGETVYLAFTYELDPPEGYRYPAKLDFNLATSGGFRALHVTNAGPGGRSTGSDSGGVLRLLLDQGLRELGMTLAGDTGSISWSYDAGSNTEGFQGTLTRVADTSTFPLPEPSGIAMGMIGACGLGLVRWRKRR